MSNELFAIWQKMGIKTKAPPNPEEKKAPVFVPKTFDNPPVIKQTQGEKRKTGTEEMKEIMAKKAAQEQSNGQKPQQKKKTYPKTYVDEMKEIMANRSAPISRPEPTPKRTALDDMKEIMKNKEEAQKDETQTAPELAPVVDINPVCSEEMKQTTEQAAIKVQEKDEEVAPVVGIIKKIEDDEQMKNLKEMLEANIKFTAGDTLQISEHVEKSEPVAETTNENGVEEQPAYQPKKEESVQEEAGYQEDSTEVLKEQPAVASEDYFKEFDGQGKEALESLGEQAVATAEEKPANELGEFQESADQENQEQPESQPEVEFNNNGNF